MEETHAFFEAMARRFFSEHTGLQHEWRPVRSLMWGARTDLICAAGTDREVWATLRPDGIAIGTGDTHRDFENFGRRLSEEEVAREAWEHFVDLLRQRGHIDQTDGD